MKKQINQLMEFMLLSKTGGISIMDNELKINMYSFTVDSKDPHELAKFYAALL